MKKLLIATILPAALLMSGVAMAGTCQDNIASIERQIEYAKQYNNRNQLAGLERALADAKSRCTPAGQLARAEQNVQKKQQDVLSAQNDVSKAQQELAEAQAKGDLKKIADKQNKVAEKQQKVQEKQAELRQAQAELAALKA